MSTQRLSKAWILGMAIAGLTLVATPALAHKDRWKHDGYRNPDLVVKPHHRPPQMGHYRLPDRGYHTHRYPHGYAYGWYRDSWWDRDDRWYRDRRDDRYWDRWARVRPE